MLKNKHTLGRKQDNKNSDLVIKFFIELRKLRTIEWCKIEDNVYVNSDNSNDIFFTITKKEDQVEEISAYLHCQNIQMTATQLKSIVKMLSIETPSVGFSKFTRLIEDEIMRDPKDLIMCIIAMFDKFLHVESPLCNALANGNMDCARLLLERGARPEEAICCAAYLDMIDYIDFLFEYNFEIEKLAAVLMSKDVSRMTREYLYKKIDDVEIPLETHLIFLGSFLGRRNIGGFVYFTTGRRIGLLTPDSMNSLNGIYQMSDQRTKKIIDDAKTRVKEFNR